MTLYILRRHCYTVYRYGTIVALEYDNGEISTYRSKFALSDPDYIDRVNRLAWEE